MHEILGLCRIVGHVGWYCQKNQRLHSEPILRVPVQLLRERDGLYLVISCANVERPNVVDRMDQARSFAIPQMIFDVSTGRQEGMGRPEWGIEHWSVKWVNRWLLFKAKLLVDLWLESHNSWIIEMEVMNLDICPWIRCRRRFHCIARPYPGAVAWRFRDWWY